MKELSKISGFPVACARADARGTGFYRQKTAYTENLVADFLDAVRTRRRPTCDVQTAHRSATVCHLGNMAIQCGSPLRWDAKKEEFIGDDAANRLRDKVPRYPYVFG